MTVRELREALARLPYNELDMVIVLPNSGEFTVSHIEPGIDSDGQPIVAIIPRED